MDGASGTNRNHVQHSFHSCAITASIWETTNNESKRNMTHDATRRNLLQRCERKMKVVKESQKVRKNKVITLRSIIFQLY